ncbi:MAG TPA: glycosyltransferase [Burkholderiales bacterium]|nr:glycosyltransferase [Burkholderiales bacterium]
MKRLLMVAYHFPPFAASTGIQRTLGFARHLPAFGWEPLILTAHPRAYEHRSDEHINVSFPMIVEHAFALDSARQLSLGGRYAAFTARPDRWISWWLGAVPKGLAMIRKYRPDAIWTTYPIATAHKIGCTLHRLSGLPWIADFRDPMAQDGYPEDPKTWQSFKRIEEATLRKAARAVFVTHGAARMYRNRYAELPETRIGVVENGYEEESFAALPGAETSPLNPGRITLLHSGVVYPNERDPTQLFAALRRLMNEDPRLADRLRIRLRASGHDSLLARLIEASGVAQIVELAPSVPYREALQEMMRADGLLVLQAANCNDQVPAKVYEYLRCGRPILALTDPAGETAALLRRARADTIAPLDSEEQIHSALRLFLAQTLAGRPVLPDPAFAREGSRRARTREFAGMLEECVDAVR